MDEDEQLIAFEKAYAERSNHSVLWLHEHGRFAVRCDKERCDDNECEGWVMVSVSSFSDHMQFHGVTENSFKTAKKSGRTMSTYLEENLDELIRRWAKEDETTPEIWKERAILYVARQRYSGETAMKENMKESYSKIVLPTKAEAVRVVETMQDILKNHGSVTISDMRELVNLQFIHADTNWGWKSLVGISVIESDNGWLIDFPEAQYLR